MFQSTRPQGARLGLSNLPYLDGEVSIHAPARGATSTSFDYGTIASSFNPRARKGRDLKIYVLYKNRIVVSIHAPAWGATNTIQTLLLIKGVSIHAPARGATSIVAIFSHVLIVSIHAPARGATYNSAAAQMERAKVSIHAPARGATQ